MNLKQNYNIHKNHSIKINSKNVIMITYTLIFVINIFVFIRLYNLYFNTASIMVLNDSLSILSLGIAITYDLLSDILVKILSYLFII